MNELGEQTRLDMGRARQPPGDEKNDLQVLAGQWNGSEDTSNYYIHIYFN
jgi:hypothetical protein